MLLNRQHRVPVSIRSLDAFLSRMRRKLSLPKSSLSVCLVSDAEMACWNRVYRGRNHPTDVLSFPVNDGSRRHRRGKGGKGRGRCFGIDLRAPAGERTSASNYLGDIAISPAAARRNSRQMGRSLDEELRILILHGALHLLGYDHESDEGEMDRRERRLRRELGLS